MAWFFSCLAWACASAKARSALSRAAATRRVTSASVCQIWSNGDSLSLETVMAEAPLLLNSNVTNDYDKFRDNYVTNL